MSDNSNNQLVIRANFNFQQKNEDKLSFTKGDIIHITGWWEGTHNGRTGWFSSNYLPRILKSPPKGFDTTVINKSCYNVVLQNSLETENEYSKELQTAFNLPTFSKHFIFNGKSEEIFFRRMHQDARDPTEDPVPGLLCQPPSTVSILTEHSEELGEFIEMKGASISLGILMLTTGSTVHMCLDKYPVLLKELERHMEVYHPDRQDTQESMTTFKNHSVQCQEVWKRKELELQILTGAIRSWEGNNIKTLGSIVYMSQVLIQCAGSEEKNERKLPMTGMTITNLEDSENHRNAFEISGSMIEWILQDLHEWVDHLQKQTKVTLVGNPTIKPHSVLSHTLASHSITRSSKHVDSKPMLLTPAYHMLPHPSHHQPPKTPKPWKDLSKSSKTMKKLLPKRRPEWKPSDKELALRKNTAALEEDAQILKVIKAYCTSAKTCSYKESAPQVLLPEEEKIIVEETKSNGQTVTEEKSLVDTVYALEDEVQELRQDNKKMKKSLEEKQRACKDLEKLVKKVLKNLNDPAWDEMNL
uniref:SH3 domain-containing protein n=1 Tax=Capra hircus TaxID=9925 RepID=A0A452DMJ6_CAPHI